MSVSQRPAGMVAGDFKVVTIARLIRNGLVSALL